MVEIWTDGGCKPNPGPGGWAAILRFRGVERELSGADPATTNNRMELTAATTALEALKRPCRVVLHTDSEYVKNGITRWHDGLGAAELAQLRGRSGGEHGSVAAAAGGGEGAPDRVALGARPFGRPDERAGGRLATKARDYGPPPPPNPLPQGEGE